MLNMKSLCVVGALATALAALACATPAAAQVVPPAVIPTPALPEPALPNGTPVRISFAPPLGVPIRYRVTETKTKNGQPETKIIELVVRFERSGETYLMEGRVELPGLPAHLAADPMINLTLRPVTFRLDRDGALTAIENEEDYWARMDPIIDKIIREEGSSPDVAELIRQMFRRMRAMPTAERAELVGRNFAHITARATVDLAIGETVETPLEELSVPLPVANPTVKRGFSIKLAGAGATRARIETETRFDPEDMARFMRQLAGLVFKGKNPPEMPRISQSFVHIVSRDTGLLVRATETSRAVGAETDVRDVKIVEVERLH